MEKNMIFLNFRMRVLTGKRRQIRPRGKGRVGLLRRQVQPKVDLLLLQMSPLPQPLLHPLLPLDPQHQELATGELQHHFPFQTMMMMERTRHLLVKGNK